MKTKLIILVIITLISGSCSSWRSTLVSNGDTNSAVQNAIIDFLYSQKHLAKEDSVFSVYVENINSDILGVSISKEINKVSLFTKNELDYDYRYFPTRYIEKNHKIFYWQDSTVAVPQGIVDKLYSMNRVDTAIYQKFFPERTIDDKLKGVHYYFCKSNLLQYKKILTNVSMRLNPKMKCGNTKIKSKEDEIKEGFKNISIGDTVKIPLTVYKSGEKTYSGFISNLSTSNNHNCVVKGIVLSKKKPKRNYLLTIQPIDICNYNEIIMSREEKITINQLFEYDVRYFKIFLKSGTTK